MPTPPATSGRNRRASPSSGARRSSGKFVPIIISPTAAIRILTGFLTGGTFGITSGLIQHTGDVQAERKKDIKRNKKREFLTQQTSLS